MVSVSEEEEIVKTVRSVTLSNLNLKLCTVGGKYRISIYSCFLLVFT